jgi:hypothetical protein
MRKQCLDRLEVRAGHRKNVRGAIDQRRCERLTAQIADVCAFFRTDLYRVQTWRLAAHRVDAGRKNFDVLAIANQTTKKPFRDRAATNITCADKEDAFHGSHGASERLSNLEANGSKSIQGWLRGTTVSQLSYPRGYEAVAPQTVRG